jgi:hypothetical protein
MNTNVEDSAKNNLPDNDPRLKLRGEPTEFEQKTHDDLKQIDSGAARLDYWINEVVNKYSGEEFDRRFRYPYKPMGFFSIPKYIYTTYFQDFEHQTDFAYRFLEHSAKLYADRILIKQCQSVLENNGKDRFLKFLQIQLDDIVAFEGRAEKLFKEGKIDIEYNYQRNTTDEIGVSIGLYAEYLKIQDGYYERKARFDDLLPIGMVTELFAKHIYYKEYLNEQIKAPNKNETSDSKKKAFINPDKTGIVTDFIRIIHSLHALNYFSETNEAFIMDKFGDFLGLDLKNHYSIMSQSRERSADAALETFEKLKNVIKREIDKKSNKM